MSTVHRRVLTVKDVRCCPSPDCSLKAGCARFTAPVPQGLGATMGNFRPSMLTLNGVSMCDQYLSHMVSDADLAAEKAKAKNIPDAVWPFPVGKPKP